MSKTASYDVASNICLALICGTTRDVYLQALEYDSTGRGMSGQEAVSMHLITPSGASHTLTAGFAERGSRYRAAVRWWEVGRAYLMLLATS